jgi:ubiquinone/menaquinone biosynthesis C-methylase UbiE
MSQKAKFLESEGNAWFTRNTKRRADAKSTLFTSLDSLQLKPKRVLEIGCANGLNLEEIRTRFDAECYGIEPSCDAVGNGRRTFPDIDLRVGTAEQLPFDEGFFDTVMFGFCLYLCDPEDHFTIAREANRVLGDPGFLVVYDFLSSVPYRRPYAHKEGIFSHKMEFSRMFLWHPSYRLLHRTYLEHQAVPSFEPDEAVTIDILRKDSSHAFPLKEASD